MSKTHLPAAAGNNRAHHFAGAGKPITDGKGPVQVVDGYHVAGFVCCPIAQSGVVS